MDERMVNRVEFVGNDGPLIPQSNHNGPGPLWHNLLGFLGFHHGCL